MHFDTLRTLLRKHEGYREQIYTCSAGKMTIGVGHNLTDLGLDPDVIELQFAHDIQSAISTCQAIFDNWHELPDMVQVVLANMAFNLGFYRLSKFKRMIKAINEKDFQTAAIEMLDSKWAIQVGDRSNELSEIMGNQDG